MNILTRQQTVEKIILLHEIKAELSGLERGFNFLRGNFYADRKAQLEEQRDDILTAIGIQPEDLEEAPFIQFLVGGKELWDGYLEE